MRATNPYAGSDCGEGCAGFKPLPGDPWSEYGICRQPGSPNRGFPVRCGQPCLNYSPQGLVPVEPLLKPNGASPPR